MTIGALARMFGLSRGTLLHYDAIGLLKPSARSDARYRVYTEDDEVRLRAICQYRAAGIPLDDIRRMLDGPGVSTVVGRVSASLFGLETSSRGTVFTVHHVTRAYPSAIRRCPRCP